MGVYQFFAGVSWRRLMAGGLLLSMMGIFFGQLSFSEAQTPTLLLESLDQPASKIVVSNEEVVVFTNFRLTAQGGDVTITDMVVEQTGVADDALFSAVLIRETATGQFIGDPLPIRADGTHHARRTVIIPDGQSVDYNIAASFGSLSSYNMQYPQLALTGITTTTQIVGTLPISGATHRTNGSVTPGNVTFGTGPGDATTGGTIQINEDSVFNSMRAVATSVEPIVPVIAIWKASGSVDYDDLSNIRTEILYKGTTYTFATSPFLTGADPEHQWISSLTGAPVIAAGDSYVIRLLGEVEAGGIGETVDFVDFAKSGVYHSGLNFGALTAMVGLYDAPAQTVTGGSSIFATVHPSNTWYKDEPEIQSFTIDNDSDEEVVVEALALDLTVATTGVTIWDKSTGNIIAGPAKTNADGVVTLTPKTAWTVPVGSGTYVITADSRASIEDEAIATLRSLSSASLFRVASY